MGEFRIRHIEKEHEYRYQMKIVGQVCQDSEAGPAEEFGPETGDAEIPDDPTTLGSQWYALRVWRELRDAILQLRFNYPTVGVISVVTKGDPRNVIALDEALERRKDHWFVREVLLQQGRALKMLDITARTFYALIETGSCFAGSLFEVALACDRDYMLNDDDDEI